MKAMNFSLKKLIMWYIDRINIKTRWYKNATSERPGTPFFSGKGQNIAYVPHAYSLS